MNLALFVASAEAQTSKLSQQLQHVDLGIQGAGSFTKTVSGPTVPINVVVNPDIITQTASTTVGALFTIRYTPKPYIGAEFNGGYARFTEGFSVAPFQIQTQSNELTFGYLVTPPYTIFGVRPYASAGAGTIRFAPTKGGGQGAPTQYRAGYYYNVGVQKSVFSDNFGLRLGFRQLFYLAPDFLQNYLTIKQRTVTSEPMVGFYLRF